MKKTAAYAPRTWRVEASDLTTKTAELPGGGPPVPVATCLLVLQFGPGAIPIHLEGPIAEILINAELGAQSFDGQVEQFLEAVRKQQAAPSLQVVKS